MRVFELIWYISNLIILFMMSYIDIKEFRIPNRLNALLFFINIVFIGMITFFTKEFGFLIERMICFFGGGTMFLLVAIISKGALGGGDIKLFSVIGLLFGIDNYILMIFLTYLIAGIYSVVFYLLKKIDRKSKIQMAPFISLSTVIVMFFGDEILRIYMDFLMSLIYI